MIDTVICERPLAAPRFDLVHPTEQPILAGPAVAAIDPQSSFLADRKLLAKRAPCFRQVAKKLWLQRNRRRHHQRQCFALSPIGRDGMTQKRDQRLVRRSRCGLIGVWHDVDV